MLVAVTHENGQVFPHFGHTKEFKVYEIEEGKVVSEGLLATGGSGHSALAGLLYGYKVDALICGGIGGGAINALGEIGIPVFAGVSGEADAAVQALIEGKLEQSEVANCDHHNTVEGHDCMSGDCPSHHSCGHH